MILNYFIKQNVIGDLTFSVHLDRDLFEGFSSLAREWPIPKYFFDILIVKAKAGRIVMELFANVAPKTAETFWSLHWREGDRDVSQAIAFQRLYLSLFHPKLRVTGWGLHQGQCNWW